MDKPTEINNRLVYMKKALSFHDEMPYDILHKILEEVDKIMGLVCGCSDNSQIVIAYTRDDLDSVLGKKSTDCQWEHCWDAIHNSDGAWSAMSDAICDAESEVEGA